MDWNRAFGRLFVVFVLFLITFIGYSSQIFVIWPWYGREFSVELLGLLVPFNILLAMLLWNYRLCVVTDPGQVPVSWRPDTHSGEGYEVKKLTGGPRYCRSCEKYKPPRAHHCRQCNRCILRMDHHCPWVNNCIGHFNYGHFIRFLFYVDLACTYHLVMVTRRVFDSMGSRYWDEPSTIELVFIVLNYTFCIPVLLAVGAFSIYHFLCLMGNSTTIEGWEKDKVATLIRRGKIREVKFPYNIGRRRNIKSVLGDNPLLWCWPTITPGTGLKYQLVEDDDSDDQEWPPRDPTTNEYFNPDHDEAFVLPPSPWTYENGLLNPNLQPSNARLRSSSKKHRNSGVASSVPPYHPDYEQYSHSSSQYASSSDSEDNKRGHRIRRGSEGYEIRPVDREEMLKRYIERLGEDEGRYQVYVPEPDIESESEVEIMSEKEDDVPLMRKVEQWRTQGVSQ